MKIIIPGGTGQIGNILARHFGKQGHEVVVLTRDSTIRESNNPVRFITWDGKSSGDWTEQVDGADVVINLAGRTVNCRYNNKNRQQMMESRVDSTRAIGRAILASTRPPKLWLQSSTATIYAHSLNEPNDEATGIIGGNEPDVPETWGFSVDVAKSWEAAANEFELARTRLVLMRSAVTMSPDREGIFDVLLGLVRKRLGGRNGSGKQLVSWIHHRDFVRAIDWLIKHSQISGPVNVCAPHPLTNTEFMRAIRQAAGIRIGLPATRWMLEIGAILMKTETELILKSRNVVPGKLLDSGFEFEFESWPAAATDLVRNMKATSNQGRVVKS